MRQQTRRVLTRREMLLQVGRLGVGGLALPTLLGAPARAAGGRGDKAKSCILVFLSGGPSQFETFDPKPQAPSEIRGAFQPIGTNVAGIQIGEHLPLLARQADKYALIRSMSHATGNHPSGIYWMMTGRPYTRTAAEAEATSRQDSPHFGAALSLVRPTPRPGIPSFVTVPGQLTKYSVRAGQSAGFLGPAHDPLVINDDPDQAGFQPGEFRLVDGLSPERLARRRSLLQQVSEQVRHWGETSGGQALDPLYERAFDLLTGSEASRALDLAQEPRRVQERYGTHVFGQSMLIARRFVEAGVRLVAVNWVRNPKDREDAMWDTHVNHLSLCKEELLPPTDRALSALLEDLHQRGLLEETLVIVMGEFGRTPRFNPEGGRDHWPYVFSVLVAGGGIRGGQVYGASDEMGAYPANDPVAPADLAATLYYCLGVDPRTEIRDRQGRPFPLAEGDVLHKLL